VGLAACWFGISGQAAYEDQLSWLVGAVGATLVSAAGIVGWLLAGVREVHREMAEVTAVIRTEKLHQVLAPVADEFELSLSRPAMSPPTDVPSVFVTNASMTRVHRPDCQLVQGRAVEGIAADEVERRGLTYCGVCCT